MRLYEELKHIDVFNFSKLIQSLILAFLYYGAYTKTINRVKNENIKIDVQSFLTFSLTS
jgi:hypothetical protein